MKKIITSIAIVAVIFTACKKEEAEPEVVVVVETPAVDDGTYKNTIAPLFEANCTSCHSAGSSLGDFTIYSGIKTDIENGKIENRALVLKDMPASKPLSDTDQEKIRTWIEKGAPND
jgi:hypothetical protein